MKQLTNDILWVWALLKEGLMAKPVVVAGGGLAGIIAALAAQKAGAEVTFMRSLIWCRDIYDPAVRFDNEFEHIVPPTFHYLYGKPALLGIRR